MSRLAAESVEERAVRLQQMSTQRKKLAAENAEEAEVRQHDKEPEGAVSARNTWPVASPTYSTACCTS